LELTHSKPLLWATACMSSTGKVKG
jgi:hypothetical protein